jgi:hypothetical protein
MILEASIIGLGVGLSTMILFIVFFKTGDPEQRRLKEDSTTGFRDKSRIVGVSYLLWQLFFPIALLMMGVLTLEQMGFRGDTLYRVPLFFVIYITYDYLMRKPGGKFIVKSIKFKTSEEVEKFWHLNTLGCLDGPIAGLHWSGAVLPLLIIAFGLFIPYIIVNAILALLVRFVLHMGAHLILEGGKQTFGPRGFIYRGVFIVDLYETIAFMSTQNVLTPMILHTISGPLALLNGLKRLTIEKVEKG